MIRMLLLTVLLTPLLALARDAGIAKRFTEHGVQGTLVLQSVNGNQRYVHNDVRAQQRFTVASTFKIANTLIALEEGVVTDQSAPFKWDGRQRSIAAWNHDQTLRSAFQVSCVWCYQRLAENIGLETYRRYLRAFDYGDLQQPAELTRFWLNGQLTLSASQQVAFLRKVQQRELPLGAHSYDTLAQVMRVEQTDDYRLYAKTGVAADTSPQIGWYVGYVETADDVWVFALNLDVHRQADIPARIALVRQVLIDKGVLR